MADIPESKRVQSDTRRHAAISAVAAMAAAAAAGDSDEDVGVDRDDVDDTLLSTELVGSAQMIPLSAGQSRLTPIEVMDLLVYTVGPGLHVIDAACDGAGAQHVSAGFAPAPVTAISECSADAIIAAARSVLEDAPSARVLIYCNPPFVCLRPFRDSCFDALRRLNVLFPGQIYLSFLLPVGGRVSTVAKEALADWRNVFPRFVFPALHFPVRTVSLSSDKLIP